MELIAIGFLLGVCVTFVIAGAVVIYDDRIHKRKSANDSDVRLYIPMRYRNRRGFERNSKRGG